MARKKIKKRNLRKKKQNKVNFATIEKKWQKEWEREKIFEVREGKKKKYYVLEMFPYPSSSGLHMGHALNYTIGDIYARFKRMNGFNVLYPMGFDALGLPAENAAIEAAIHPKKFTNKAINNFIKQQKTLGLSYDWSRMIKTCNPEYYRWNQYFFLKFYEKGLVYRKKAPVNWCPKCRTVLANEQVHDGKCWRHEDTDVRIKHLEQWFLKITKYADELLRDIEKLNWPEKIKIMQKNWIGKSEGVDVYFKLEGTDKILPTFTTRCDTTHSVTFLGIAPEHPLAIELVKGTKYEKGAKGFISNMVKQSIEDRTNEEKEKEGYFTGKYAINPVNNKKIPIYIANFAVMYGSGIVMCDAHDKRDFRFAKKYGIPLKFVISKDGKPIYPKNFKDAFVDDGVLFNSGKFSGMKNKEALPKIADWLEQKKLGKKATNYKLRDWLVSRQRYWGTPIPIIYCEKCGEVPVPEKFLPVKLPEKVKFGKGNPLATNKSFVNVKCPKCKGEGKRETDTMDTFFDSSWYFLRYCDNKNKKKAFDRKKVKYWMPVDQYIGGAEHACMHLIYARFFVKALRDLGFLKINEPFIKLFNQGMLHGSDGAVMSKSRGNVVLPGEVSKRYGIDTARLFLVSVASPDKDVMWSEKGIEGSLRFIKKLYDLKKFRKTNKLVESKLNKTIREVSEDIENFQYNLAVIKIRELFESFDEGVSKRDFEKFLKLLSPFCPHTAEELWHKLGNKTFISLEKWPKAGKIDEKLLKQEKLIEKLLEDIKNILKILQGRGKKSNRVKVFAIPYEVVLYEKAREGIEAKIGMEVEILSIKYAKTGEKKIKAKPGKPGILIE